MKTKEYVIEHYNKFETFLDDRFGQRFADFISVEDWGKIGFEFTGKEDEKPTPKEWTRENILAQLKEDVEFGFEKALNKRSISASLMFEVVRSWNRVLEEGLEDWSENNYRQYGLPLFKATAVKYGWDNPIGDDCGDEEKYSCDY